MSSRHENNGTVSHRSLTHNEAKRLLEAALIDAANNANHHLQQEETVSESLPANPPGQEVVKRFDSTTTNGNHSEFESPCDPASQKIPPMVFSADPEYDTMSYPYRRYNGKADDVRAFLTT